MSMRRKCIDAMRERYAVADTWDEVLDAVLDALMEPSPKMLDAAAGAMSPAKRPTPNRVSCRQKHKIRYQAMIRVVKDN